ncbi:polyprenyl synthetase family protein [Streptomyces sp. NPDC058611]|uniref:polyprenyl synthetase family protein n=1 Tax=unclassified Streptomyces TaxID=2593676 RepID=UPI00365CA2D1
MELVHAAACTHDDIIDDSRLRHGVPTAHAAFAEAGAGRHGGGSGHGRGGGNGGAPAPGTVRQDRSAALRTGCPWARPSSSATT